MDDGAETQCPYCGESLWIAIDVGGGRRQNLITDCEVCCRPIQVQAIIDQDGITVSVASEDELLS